MKKLCKTLSVYTALAAVCLTSFLLLSNTNSKDILNAANFFSKDFSQNVFNLQEYFFYKHASLDGSLDYSNLVKGIKEAERQSIKKSGNIGIQWYSMGPNNIGGRTRCILVDKDNPQLMWMGAVSGGIFKSTDGGNLWAPINDVLPNAIISCMAQAINGDIYIGTGNIFEAFGNPEWPGMGIYKSTDGGNTFNLLPSTFPTDNLGNPDSSSVTAKWTAVQKIVCDANNPNIIYAGTNKGLQVSKDGGVTWFNPLYIDCPSTTLSQEGAVHDLEYNADKSRLFVVVAGGLYYSDAPTETCSFVRGVNGLPNSSQRMEIAHAPSNKDIIYVSTISANDFSKIFKSTDKGASFTDFSPAPPVNDLNWDICGSKRSGSGFCFYTWSMAVDPDNSDVLFLGSQQLWRYDGNWTRATTEIKTPNQTGPSFYVHEHKHGFYFNPHNSNQLLILTSGGLFISNDGGYTFFESNKNFISTGFYGLSFSKEGIVVGGSLNRGNILLNSPELNGGDLGSGLTVTNSGITNGDGFDTETSQITDFRFTTAQFGNVGRGPIKSLNGSGICAANINLCGAASFWTVIRLWESDRDLTSKDSIEFTNNRFSQGLGVGNNSRTTFQGVLRPAHKAASVLYNTVGFSAGNLVLNYDNGNFTGDGIGVLNTSSGEFTITFNTAPPNNQIIYAHFDMVFRAGDTLELQSQNANLPLNHVLTNDLNPGQSIKIQDPIQSLLAMGANQGIAITRSAISSVNPIFWMNISQGLNSTETPVSGNVNAIEFTKDGNTMFVAAWNRIYRITGLNKLYKLTDRSMLSSKLIWSSSEGNISGLALNPENEENLVACVSAYGSKNPLNLITNAISTSGISATITQSKMGASNGNPLPRLPVYDAEWDIVNPSRLIVGTLYGIWATNDIYANNVNWSYEGGDMGKLPVYDIRQQHLPFNKASNHEVMYAATFGRGIWTTESLVSVKDFSDIRIDNTYQPDLKIFPNPVLNSMQISYEMPKEGFGILKVFTISGKLIYENNLAFSQGENTINFDASKLPQGTYIAIVQMETFIAKGKFVKY